MSNLAVKWEKGVRVWHLRRQVQASLANAARARGRSGAPILVANLAQMGDVVLSAGVVACLRERHPQSPILFMAQPRWLDVLQGDPNVDGLLGAKSLFEIRALAGLFETVYVLDIPIPNLLDYFDGVPNIHRYQSPTTGDWFTYNKKLISFYEQNAGLPEGSARSRIWIRPEDHRYAEGLLAKHGLQNCPSGGPLIGLHTQSSMDSKNWPVEHWAALLTRWQATQGASFVVLGGPGEGSALQSLPGVTHLAGHLTLKQTAAMIARCDLFAGLDSGLAYIAEAVGTPGMIVLGSTVQETSGPRSADFTFVRAPEACLPACHRVCTKSTLCVTQLSVDAVDLALRQTWDRVSRTRGKEALCASL